ncbi:MAG: purine-binding chemotaxis protein CheW [Chloroflexi bacterium]|nr:purine-binding chemotaxis protein CheW [Chloroflexota bacterium]
MNDHQDDQIGLAADDTIENMYLTFMVEKETYAVNIACVTEIVGIQRISEIPDVPDYIKGAMNLRGKVIPVMDQRLRFHLPARNYDDRTTIIVLDLEGVPTGLVVDQVTDVLTIPPAKIDPPPHWLHDGKRGVIKGLGKLDDNVSIILDVPHLLYDKNVEMDLSKVMAQV